MTSCPANLMGLQTTKNVVSSECPACCVTAYQFPLGNKLDFHDAIDLGLPLDKFFETYILDKLLQIPVIAGYVGSERRFIAILLQYLVSGLAVKAHPLDVDSHISASLLLEDGEDVSVKAGLIYSHHVGESLTEVAGEHEHISHLLQLADMLRSAVDCR